MMIGPELELKAVDGASVRRGHHAGVVDQQVDVVVGNPDLVSERSYRTEVGKIELPSRYRRPWRGRCDFPHRLRALRIVATGHDHPGATPGELARDDATEPAVGAGDDGRAAVQVRDLFGGPLASHGLSC